MGARLLKDPSTASCRVFVGHLQTDETNKIELEQHFSKYGLVIGSLINRGFGFVQYENEQSAQAAIKQENGQIFKGRRIDVRPAKKDTGHGHGGGSGGGGNSGDGGDKSKPQGNQQFGQKNNSFQQRNNSFGSSSSGGGGGGGGGSGNSGGNSSNGGNTGSNANFNAQKQNFGGGNQSNNCDTSFDDNTIPPNNPPQATQEQFNPDANKSHDENNFQQFDDNTNETMNNVHQNRDNVEQNNQLNSGSQNQNRGSGNNQFGGNNQNRMDDSSNAGGSGGPGGNQGGETSPQNNQNRSGNSQFNQGNQNRAGNNQNRNQNNQGGGANSNQGQGGGGGGGSGSGGGSQSRPRGNRGGKNKNKNRNDHSGGGNNFRDRSPLNRGSRGGNENKSGGGGGGGGGPRDWDHGMMPRNNNFNRDSFNDNGRFEDRFKDAPMGGINYDYPPAVPDKNDCEIIVVNKSLTEYAEAIEGRLKKMGLTVDLLFPNEEVPLSRVLGNIANRGCLYGIVVTPINMEHHSMTLNILHGLPQEHRNMPVEDALGLINRDFSNYKSGGRAVPFNTPFANDRHPDAIQVLFNMLADNHQLTVLQFDRVLKYLEIKREEQVQAELGDTKDLVPSTISVNDPKQAELQSRILNILNSNKPTNTTSISTPSPVPAPNPAPVPPSVWASAVSTTTPQTSTTTTSVAPSPLLNDPTVQKALDSLLQGNLLKSIGDSSQTAAPTSTAPQPLFAAFPNIDRF